MNIKSILTIVHLCVLALFITSCGGGTGGSKSDSKSGGTEVTIDSPAGQSWTSGGDGYLPCPANVGMYRNMPVLVLCDAIDKGDNVNVEFLAALRLEEGGSKSHYLIAIPADPAERTMPVDDFSDLITSHSSAKWIVEQYMLNRNGLGQASLIGWEDKSYVINKLLNNNF